MAAAPNSKHHIFLSYSREDQAVAYAVVDACQRAGLSIWYDRMIPPNRDWAAAIVENIEHSDMLVILFSEHSNESTQLARELAVADARGMVVYPVFVENVRPRGSYAFRLATEQRFEMFPKPLSMVDALVSGLQRHFAPEQKPRGHNAEHTQNTSTPMILPDPSTMNTIDTGSAAREFLRRSGSWFAVFSISCLVVGFGIDIFDWPKFVDQWPLVWFGGLSLVAYGILSASDEQTFRSNLCRDSAFASGWFVIAMAMFLLSKRSDFDAIGWIFVALLVSAAFVIVVNLVRLMARASQDSLSKNR